MKTRIIKNACLLLCLVMLISGCSMYNGNSLFSKKAVEITAENFLEYFDLSASFENFSTNKTFMEGIPFYNATCTMHLKCTPKSNFEIESVTADVNFEANKILWRDSKNKKDYKIKETLYINKNSTGDIDKVLTNHGGVVMPELPTGIMSVEVTEATGTIYI